MIAYKKMKHDLNRRFLFDRFPLLTRVVAILFLFSSLILAACGPGITKAQLASAEDEVLSYPFVFRGTVDKTRLARLKAGMPGKVWLPVPTKEFPKVWDQNENEDLRYMTVLRLRAMNAMGYLNGENYQIALQAAQEQENRAARKAASVAYQAQYPPQPAYQAQNQGAVAYGYQPGYGAVPAQVTGQYPPQQYAPRQMAPEAAPARQLKLAVMEIEDISKKLDPGVSGRGTDYLRATINATRKFIVIDKSRQAEALTRMVVEQKKDSYKECYDQSCQVPLGQALAADTILRTQITVIGSFCTVASEMVDLAKEAAVGGGLQKFDCTEDGLGMAIEKLVPQIVRN